MRIALSIIIGIHGIIHLLGFLKAFSFVDFNSITQVISKPIGILWLLTFLLFTISFILFVIHSCYWMIVGFLAISISQILIIIYWNDTKFGTLLNLVILTSILISYSTFNFNKKVNDEIAQMLVNSTLPKDNLVLEHVIKDLPKSVQKWLINSGVVGKETIKNVFFRARNTIVNETNAKRMELCQCQTIFHYRTTCI